MQSRGGHLDDLVDIDRVVGGRIPNKLYLGWLFLSSSCFPIYCGNYFVFIRLTFRFFFFCFLKFNQFMDLF